jgi:hypothetical protein
MKLTPQEIEQAREMAYKSTELPIVDSDLIEAGAQAHADKLSKLTPEGLREEIKLVLMQSEYYPALTVAPIGSLTWRNKKVEAILSLLNYQIEQAVTKERERIAHLIDHWYEKELIEKRQGYYGILEALKDGK